MHRGRLTASAFCLPDEIGTNGSQRRCSLSFSCAIKKLIASTHWQSGLREEASSSYVLFCPIPSFSPMLKKRSARKMSQVCSKLVEVRWRVRSKSSATLPSSAHVRPRLLFCFWLQSLCPPPCPPFRSQTNEESRSKYRAPSFLLPQSAARSVFKETTGIRILPRRTEGNTAEEGGGGDRPDSFRSRKGNRLVGQRMAGLAGWFGCLVVQG